MGAVDVDETWLAKLGTDLFRLASRPLPPDLILAAIKHATAPVAVRAREPKAPTAEIGRRIAVIDPLDNVFAVAAVRSSA